jgi:hypothetical protein
MRHRRSPLFALFCAFFLLAAQMAAYVHATGHLATDVATLSTAATPAHDSGDGDTHSCATCIAFAALGAAPPAFVAPLSEPDATSIAAPPRAAASAAGRPTSPYIARAPPVVLL